MSVVDRIIYADEWYLLDAPIKRLFGEDKQPPAPEMCMGCAIREEDGVVTGFLFLQLVPHLEPFGSLGGVSFSSLKHTIDEFITSTVGSIDYYAHFSDNLRGEQVALDNGFKPAGMLYFGRPNPE